MFLDPSNVCSTCSFTCIPETLDHFNSYCPFSNRNFSLALLLRLPCLPRLLFIVPAHILFKDCPCKTSKRPANYNYNCISTFCRFYYSYYWFTQLQTLHVLFVNEAKFPWKRKTNSDLGTFCSARWYLIRRQLFVRVQPVLRSVYVDAMDADQRVLLLTGKTTLPQAPSAFSLLQFYGFVSLFAFEIWTLVLPCNTFWLVTKIQMTSFQLRRHCGKRMTIKDIKILFSCISVLFFFSYRTF